VRAPSLRIYRVVAALLSVALLAWHVRLYLPSASAYGTTQLGGDVLAQLRFLDTALQARAGEQMQTLFPEGFFFSHALPGLAWVDVGLRAAPGSPQRQEALAYARRALAQLDTPAATAPFSTQLDPPRGVFYVGWRAWLLGGVLQLQDEAARDAGETARFLADTAALAQAFQRSPSPFLAAYPGQAWPCDSVVALAALRLHDTLFQPRYAELRARWLAAAQQQLDPATGLLPHRADLVSGQPLEGARGSSQSIIARFLVEVDPAWGQAQYARFRALFVDVVLGVPGVREYPRGTTGPGDVDSGPLLAGISLSASAVTLGAALLHNDRALAAPLLHLSEFAGMPLSWQGQKRYALGLLPVGDAFLVWAKSAQPRSALVALPALPPVVHAAWRLPLHGAALLVLALLWVPSYVPLLRRAKRRASVV
jgi:hypothetical protein